MNLHVYFYKDWLIVSCLCLAENISGREQVQQYLTVIQKWRSNDFNLTVTGHAWKVCAVGRDRIFSLFWLLQCSLSFSKSTRVDMKQWHSPNILHTIVHCQVCTLLSDNMPIEKEHPACHLWARLAVHRA